MNAPRSPSDAFVIPSLDGLRAISFLIVFAGHGGLTFGPPMPAGFGVAVFFFLSGYLITTLLRLEYERTGRNDLKLFYLRRALRIWPPFYLVLFGGVLLVMTGVIEAKLELGSLVSQILHFFNYWTISHGWTGTVPGSGVYWSLAVEEHFYLLFPALYIWLRRRGFTPVQQLSVFLAICALVAAWRCVLVFGFHPSVERTFVATDTRIDSILFGCGLAVYRNPALDIAPQDKPRAKELIALFAGLGTLVFTFLWRDDRFRETVRYTVQGVALYPVFSMAVRFPGWGLFRVLNLRVMRFLGTLSYSLYLVHHTVIDTLASKTYGPFEPFKSAILLGVCIALSYAIWHFVEEPCAALRRKLARASAAAEAKRKQVLAQ